MRTYVDICPYNYHVHWQEERGGHPRGEGRGPEARCCSLPRWGGSWTLREGRRALLSRERGRQVDLGRKREGWAAGEEAGGRKYTFINHMFTEQRDCPF